ncbi:MAG: cellulase family glycosylhydrolase [Armatimonadetes bacterium]|nr:cellulase family glycosylhydrolase [Armatimonadota bacterium]
MLVLTLAAQLLLAGEPAWFPFSIPDLATAATDGADLDLSYLNAEPAGAHGRLRARGEQVVDERGQPVRLIGSNITDFWPMMPKEQAEPAARRLAQLGMNCVRFHYYDWDVAPRGILNADRQTLNPEKLDQLDWFFAKLKQHGVYVDLNLHVARGYADMPPGWDWMGKHLDFVHEPYIESQLRFARELLDHRNTYTGLRYADDPGVAVIELNNENTALTNWGQYAALPAAFSEPLRAKWNAWLKAHYPSTEALARAWGGGLVGPELVRGMDPWAYQKVGGHGTLTAMVDATAPTGKYLRWDVTAPGTAFYHHQLMASSVPVQARRTYTLSFMGRCRPGGSDYLDLSMMLQVEPWSQVAAGSRVKLTPEWRRCEVSLVVGDPAGRPVRMNLNADNQMGTFDLAGLSLREGEPDPLAPGERLETGSVKLVGNNGTSGQARDYVAFLVDCEADYVARLRRLIRDELRSDAMVLCTQASYGGACGWLREAPGEVTDMHAYPAHPRQVTVDGRQYWTTDAKSMVREANGGLRSLANWRVAGKPFFVTEFDLNPPNPYAAECFPLLATLGSYQGWSCLLDYAWYNFGSSPGRGYLTSAFGTTGHSGQMAMIPASALLYRLGLVKPAEQRVELTVPQAACIAATARDRGGWQAVSWSDAGVDSLAPWLCGTAVTLVPGEGQPKASRAVPAPQGQQVVTDTGQVTWDRTRGAERLLVNAPAARLVAGFVGGQTVELGDVTLHFGGAPGSHAIAALVSLDGQPIRSAKRVLLSVVGRVRNTEQKTNVDGVPLDWGRGPVLAEPVPLTVTMPPVAKAVALDENGRARGAQPLSSDRRKLECGGGAATMWYLLTR